MMHSLFESLENGASVILEYFRERGIICFESLRERVFEKTITDFLNEASFFPNGKEKDFNLNIKSLIKRPMHYLF